MQAQASPYPTSSVQSPPTRPQIHWLLATASAVVIIASVGWVASTVWGIVRELKHEQKAIADEAQAKAEALEKEARATARPGSMERSTFTNGEAAHFTLTNTSDAPLFQWLRGVVEGKSDGHKAKSVVVCSGDVRPHSTVTLEAPYRVGAVQELCQGKPDPYGHRYIDWTLCTFDVEAVEAPAKSPSGGTP
jgi:hypothetical protein